MDTRDDRRSARFSGLSCGRALLRVFGALIAILFVGAGCSTVPEVAPPRAYEYVPAGYGGYFAVDVAGNQDRFLSIADQLDANVGAILRRTDEAAGAFNLFASEAPQMAIVATGEFPKCTVQFALRRDRTLSRERIEIDGERQLFFAREDTGLQIAIPENGRIYAGTGSVPAMLAGELEVVPSEVSGVLAQVGTDEGPDAILYLPDPGQNVLGRLGIDARGLPVMSVTLALTVDSGPADTAEAAIDSEGFVLAGAVEMQSAAQAVLLSRVGRFFILALMRGLGLDVQAAIDRVETGSDGPEMVFRNIPVSEDEVVALIRRMAVSE